MTLDLTAYVPERANMPLGASSDTNRFVTGSGFGPYEPIILSSLSTLMPARLTTCGAGEGESGQLTRWEPDGGRWTHLDVAQTSHNVIADEFEFDGVFCAFLYSGGNHVSLPSVSVVLDLIRLFVPKRMN